MTFLLRTLCAVIGAAFLFAVANLALSGLPSDAPPVALASDAATRAPGTLRDVPQPLLGGASSQVYPAAAPSALAQGIEADWRDWAATHGIAEGALVVLFPNGTMHRVAMERATTTSVPVASLSKAITGICLDIVLREQGLSWYTSLGDIAPQMSDVRVTPQRWNDRITLAALANHTSGLAPDLTQGTMGSTLHGALGLHRRIASEALREENMQGTARDYVYSNTNYAVLGVVIEALTGQSYSDACLDRVIAPAGITDAVIHGAMGSRSSFAGWEMSAEAYARLAQHWFSGTATDLVARPFDRPMHNNYSIGYVIHGRGDAAQVSHAGHFCNRDGTGTGAYFHARGDGVVVSANWSGGCVSATDTGLDVAIANRM
ncbi:serine hydrolase domain-containing protein [Jannaschia sp. CCS1]|uniref:serine hydrolase domain-containing protein n=1 Tax=Jannaschia sp. (strain CCS1) TaxID=290400 RepID=UPI000053AE75|nr:serine hydrolase domain-containing protein [Jannaschia sp. CCS1]ABD56061.1 beta-lactamase [Jannaschia sp. CCS1]